MRRGTGLALSVAAFLAAQPTRADQPLNPKDALAPIFRENPKLADPQADLLRLRNEGIAHYEGGLTLDRAITSFQSAYDIGHQPVDAFDMALVYIKQNKLPEAREWLGKALDGNPDFAAAQYVMGVIDKLDGHPDAARARWIKANALQPMDANLHYELAMLASADKDEHTFLQELVRALELDPDHKSSLYQMYRYYQRSGNKEMAASTLKRFNAVKATERFTRKERPFDESSFSVPLRADPLHGKGGFAFIDSAVSMAATRTPVGCSLAHLTGITVIQAPAREDLLGVCADGGLLRITSGEATPIGKLDPAADAVQVDWIGGQGPRIVTAGPSGVSLSGSIDRLPLAFETIDATPATRLVLADFDHDGSLDILTDAAPAPLASIEGRYKRLAGPLTNSALGHAFHGGGPVAVADMRRRGMADLLSVDGANIQLIMDGSSGYQDGPKLHLDGDGAVSQLAVADLDNDGVLDVVAANADGVTIFWGVGGPVHPAPAANITAIPLPGGPVRLAIADLNNDGRRDIVTVDPAGHLTALLNKGPRDFEARPLATVSAPAGDLIALDDNHDGLTDVAYVDTTGALVVLRNTSTDVGKSFDVLLNGRRSPATGHLTQVELRSGDLYSYAQSDGGILHFGLGGEDFAQIVRLEWPNGFVENKIKVDASLDPYVYLESERISGSCPTIFVQTQDGFRYVTDAMITTAIGILEQRGEYFGFGDREHVVIPPGLMTPIDGKLQLRITEELRETTYIDHAELMAVDIPAGSRIGSTVRLAPPSGEEPPYYVARKLVPAAHVSFEGTDVTDLLAHQDHRYANTVHRTRNPGFAGLSTLDIELGADVDPAKVDAVYGTGWFQAFDSTAVIGAFKGEQPDMQFPELQEDVGGTWRHVGYLGIPAGQNRTIVMPLDKPLQSRHLRLLSSFSVYWDELAFSVGGTAPAKTADLRLEGADLRFHGFSQIASRDPEVFDYANVDYGMMWSPMAGRFTDYGPVEPLIREKDGNYAVIGGGDELALTFKAPPAPPAPGFERAYILVLDGHVKDADRYTAKSDDVEPMPYLTMRAFPGKPGAPVDPESAMSAKLRQRVGLDYTLGVLSSGKELPK